MKILIIEDEHAAVRRLSNLLREVAPESEILAAPESVEQSVRWLKEHQSPDLIFMDIQLADGSSFEIFEQVQIDAPIIFTTAYDEYAVKAFKVNSVDYLLKPLKKEELAAAIRKLKNLRSSALSQVALQALLRTVGRPGEQKPERFVITQGQKIVAVEVKDIAYFFSKNKVVFLRTFKGASYPLDHSLDKIEEMVKSSGFFRINRHLIVSLKSIEEMHSWTKSRVKIKLNPPCELDSIVSVERSPHFKEWLKKA